MTSISKWPYPTMRYRSPPAVDVAAPGGEGEQGGVDQQLLVQVAVAAGRVLQIRPRPHLQLLTVSGSDIADVRRYREDIIMQIVHRLPSSGLPGQRCRAAATARLPHRPEHDNLHAAATTERNAASPVTVCHHPSGTRARLPRHTADLRQMALDGLSNGVTVAARHVIGRLLDLLHISWQTCAAHQTSDHTLNLR